MVRTYPGKSLWIVLVLLVNLAAAELCGAVQVEHKSPRELVQRVFPEAKAWKETRLSADVVMFCGLLERTSYGVKAHMYATVRMRAGKPQLSMTYAVAAESDQNNAPSEPSWKTSTTPFVSTGHSNETETG